jgi:CHASE3 domain sensor protein
MGLETIQNYIIGIVLFMLIIGGGVYMFGSFVTYDTSIDSNGSINNFNSKLNLASNITTTVNQMTDNVNSVSAEDTGVLGWINALIGSAYDGIKSIGQSIGFMGNAMAETGSMFGIPSFIIALVSLIILILLVFAIWMAITKAG